MLLTTPPDWPAILLGRPAAADPTDLDAAVRTIAGSARSMGITVEGVK